MKLAILCTMMKRFGIKGFYNSQEIGLGRALSELGHTVTVYKGVKDKTQVETVQINERLTVQKNEVVTDKYGNHKNTWTDYFSLSY